MQGESERWGFCTRLRYLYLTKSNTLCILLIVRRKLFHQLSGRIDEPEAIVVTGMRRVGKTTLIRQVYDSLNTANKIFLDLENPLNQKFFEETNYDAIKYRLETLGIDFSKRGYVFLDEIQFIRNLPSVAKYLIDHYRLKFFLTGSSSFYLKNLFSESMAGRKIIYELFPLDFEEFLELKGSKLVIPKQINEATYLMLAPFYKEFVEFGGFPGVIIKQSLEEKREALHEIFTTYFNKEVLTIGGFRNNQVVRDLMLLLINRIGSKIDVQKLSRELGVTRITINEYLAFLEGTYFISLISPYSTNSDVEIRSAKKVYLCDSGLVNNLGNVPFGSVFENAVYNELRLKAAVKYFQKKSGVEIDFIMGEDAFEVKTKGSDYDLKRLQRIVKGLSLKTANVISFEYSTAPVMYGFQI